MRFLVSAALLAMTLNSAAHAQVAREEIYSFQSETLSDADFLNGKTGTPVNIAGALRLPRVGSEKLPAVILLHGSGGMQGYGSPSEEWSRELNAIGIAIFRIDSFASRGIVETVTDQSRLGRLNMIIDAYRALQLLAAHRQIDPSRVAVMGFSRGAQSAVYSSLPRFQATHGLPKGLEFAAHIGLYTPCNTTYQGEDTITKPIRLLHGMDDDYVAMARAALLWNGSRRPGRTSNWPRIPMLTMCSTLPS
jgi:dienelactone hydrolase